MEMTKEAREELEAAGGFVPSETFASWASGLSDERRSTVTATEIRRAAQGRT